MLPLGAIREDAGLTLQAPVSGIEQVRACLGVGFAISELVCHRCLMPWFLRMTSPHDSMCWADFPEAFLKASMVLCLHSEAVYGLFYQEVLFAENIGEKGSSERSTVSRNLLLPLSPTS